MWVRGGRDPSLVSFRVFHCLLPCLSLLNVSFVRLFVRLSYGLLSLLFVSFVCLFYMSLLYVSFVCLFPCVSLFLCASVCVYVRVNVFMCVCVCVMMMVSACLCVRMCVYIYMSVCTYVCIYPPLSFIQEYSHCPGNFSKVSSVVICSGNTRRQGFLRNYLTSTNSQKQSVSVAFSF